MMLREAKQIVSRVLRGSNFLDYLHFITLKETATGCDAPLAVTPGQMRQVTRFTFLFGFETSFHKKIPSPEIRGRADPAPCEGAFLRRFIPHQRVGGEVGQVRRNSAFHQTVSG
jgi:hypothetical protein